MEPMGTNPNPKYLDTGYLHKPQYSGIHNANTYLVPQDPSGKPEGVEQKAECSFGIHSVTFGLYSGHGYAKSYTTFENS